MEALSTAPPEKPGIIEEIKEKTDKKENIEVENEIE